MALKATPNTDWVYPPKTAYQSRSWDVRLENAPASALYWFERLGGAQRV